MGPRAAVFDWDGTLVRSNATLIAACRATTEGLLGQTYPATPVEEQMLFQLGTAEALQMLCDGGDAVDDVLAEFDVQYRQRAREIVTYPDVSRVLEELREAGWRVGVLSNGSRTRVREEQRRLGLLSCVDASVFSGDSSSWIPHPAPLLAVLDSIGSDATESVFIGDAPADIRAGRAAGMRTAAAMYGYESSRVETHACDIALDTPASLLDALLDASEGTTT